MIETHEFPSRQTQMQGVAGARGANGADPRAGAASGQLPDGKAVTVYANGYGVTDPRNCLRNRGQY